MPLKNHNKKFSLFLHSFLSHNYLLTVVIKYLDGDVWKVTSEILVNVFKSFFVYLSYEVIIQFTLKFFNIKIRAYISRMSFFNQCIKLF